MSANRAFAIERRWLAEDAAANVALTPLWLVEEIRAVLDGIDVDPCTTSENPTGAMHIITLPRDGVTEPWPVGAAFVNPPFSGLERWAQRIDAEAATGRPIVAIAPAHTDTGWFGRLAGRASDIVFVLSRVVFDGGTVRVHRRATDDGAPAVAIVVVGYNVDLAPLAHLGLVASPRACATNGVSPFRRPPPAVSLEVRGSVGGHGYGYVSVERMRVYFGPCDCGRYVLGSTDGHSITHAAVRAVRAEIETRFKTRPCVAGCGPGGRRRPEVAHG